MDTDASDQERAFIEREADAWFERNFPDGPSAVGEDNIVLQALREVELPPSGMMLDVGGGPGHLAAGFLRGHPEWTCHVLEASPRAIAAGSVAFPRLRFARESVAAAQGLPWHAADLVVVSGVFSWVDRALLARAVANVDAALRDGGWLVVSDFDSPSLRANPYHHRPGLYTYKQDYSAIFTALGTYHVSYRRSEDLDSHTASDEADRYDRQWSTAVLRKDSRGRYFRGR